MLLHVLIKNILSARHCSSHLDQSSSHHNAYINLVKINCISWKLKLIISILLLLECRKGFPGGSNCKESACNEGDLGSIPGLERSPGGGHGNPLQYCCLENPHGQRSLAGYSPWGHKESDTSEQLNTAQNRMQET